MSFTVLYADDRLIAVDKPAGMLSVAGLGPENQDNLARHVAADFPGARNVHRLDRDTSGVLVMARDAAAHRELSRQFQDREVEKVYVAVVFGAVADEFGRIDRPLAKDFARPPRHRIDDEHGRPAITDWKVIERAADRTRLKLVPHTGRSHQLRVHLAEIGHPILGDNLYAHQTARTMSKRMLLHALAVTITHPATGQRMTFDTACPF